MFSPATNKHALLSILYDYLDFGSSLFCNKDRITKMVYLHIVMVGFDWS